MIIITIITARVNGIRLAVNWASKMESIFVTEYALSECIALNINYCYFLISIIML